MATIVREYVRGDRRPALKVRLVHRDAQGRRVPADLSAAAGITFLLATPADKKLFERSMVVLDAAGGVVAYEWQASDLDRTPGEYRGWVTIDWGSGTPETETRDDLKIIIRKRPT